MSERSWSSGAGFPGEIGVAAWARIVGRNGIVTADTVEQNEIAE